MPDSLTGDFDAVVQVGVGAVNRILATLHQHGAATGGGPSLPHVIVARVGDPIPTAGPGPSPVGVAPRPWPGPEIALPVVRGMAEVQLGAPTVALAGGSAAEVTVRCDIRARYTPDPGSVALPRFIRGVVRATLPVAQVPWEDRSVLTVGLDAEDADIAFLPAPAPPLSEDERDQVARQVRRFVRTRFEPTGVVLPKGPGAWRLEKLVAGGLQALALLVDLSGSGLPPTAAGTTRLLVTPADDLAVAVGRRFLVALLRPALDAVRAIREDVPITARVFGYTLTVATYAVRVDDAGIDLQAGALELAIRGRATTGSLLPNYTFAVRQRLRLALDPVTQDLRLSADGDPSISGLPGFAVGRARARIVAARDAALVAARPHLLQAKDRADGALASALASLGVAAERRYTGLEVDPDGVILRGALRLPPRPPVRVDLRPTPDGTGLTALRSWVPGGTVERFTWTGARHTATRPWVENVEVSREDRFVLDPPDGRPNAPGRWCLRVEGTRARSDGGPDEAVVGGASCALLSPISLFTPVAPHRGRRFVVPVWGGDAGRPGAGPGGPDPTPSIVAHVDLGGVRGPAGVHGHPVVVHFADAGWADQWSVLDGAVRGRDGRASPLSLVVVLPPGALAQAGAALAERLGSIPRCLPLAMALTEDYEGGWERSFDVRARPSTYLVTAEGELAWRDEGPAETAALTDALERHAAPVGALRQGWARPAVGPGDPAPDFLFEYAAGERLPLRRLRGRRILLLFWASWSEPCLSELRRLHARRGHERSGMPLVLAVNDGEPPERGAEIFRRHGIDLRLVPDPDRRIAWSYGINAWPTEVAIGEDGLVEHVHHGAHGADGPDARAR